MFDEVKMKLHRRCEGKGSTNACDGGGSAKNIPSQTHLQDTKTKPFGPVDTRRCPAVPEAMAPGTADRQGNVMKQTDCIKRWYATRPQQLVSPFLPSASMRTA
jgi:hypothetical protein